MIGHYLVGRAFHFPGNMRTYKAVQNEVQNVQSIRVHYSVQSGLNCSTFYRILFHTYYKQTNLFEDSKLVCKF